MPPILGRDTISAQIRAELLIISQMYNKSNINLTFEKAESSAEKSTKQIESIIAQLALLRKNLGGNQTDNTRLIQTNLIEMVSQKIIGLNNLVVTLKPTLEVILEFIRQLTLKTASILDPATQTSRRDIVAKIIEIQEKLTKERDLLLTLKNQLDIIDPYFRMLAKTQNSNYAVNIESECRKETIFTILNILKDLLILHFTKRGTKTQETIMKTKTEIAQFVSTI